MGTYEKKFDVLTAALREYILALSSLSQESREILTPGHLEVAHQMLGHLLASGSPTTEALTLGDGL